MELIIIGILILLNGFFALSEIALVSSKKTRLEQLKNDGHKGAATALLLLKNSGNFLSAIQVGITLIGIITGVYGGISIADDISPFFSQFEVFRTSAQEVALTITILIITYFSIVLGELVPKTIALSNPEKIAVRIAPIISLFSKVFFPFVKFLSYSTKVINTILRIKPHNDQLTEAELRQMIRTASTEGVIENDQNILHERIFYFSDKKAKHVMTHRMEVEWIDLTMPSESIREKILHSQHSKVICSQNVLDNFIGVLLIKDFLRALAMNESVKIQELLTQPLIIPENAEARKVLTLFRKTQNYLAVIVNEYGSFEGIVTMHDLMENIIGDIPEEGETSEPDIFVRDDKSFLISGDAPVEILDGILDNYMTDFENIDYSTVAGFVLNNLNKIPQIGDTFEFSGNIIEILDLDGKRIDKILIRKKEKDEVK